MNNRMRTEKSAREIEAGGRKNEYNSRKTAEKYHKNIKTFGSSF